MPAVDFNRSAQMAGGTTRCLGHVPLLDLRRDVVPSLDADETLPAGRPGQSPRDPVPTAWRLVVSVSTARRNIAALKLWCSGWNENDKDLQVSPFGLPILVRY
jgi:hypothetical protein